MTTVYRSWESITSALQKADVSEDELLRVLGCNSCVADMKSAHTGHRAVLRDGWDSESQRPKLDSTVVDRDGETMDGMPVESTKGSPWDGPFHQA